MNSTERIHLTYDDENNNYTSLSTDINFNIGSIQTYTFMKISNNNLNHKKYYYGDTIKITASIIDQNNNPVKYGKVQFYFNNQKISTPKLLSKENKEISILHIPKENGQYYVEYIKNEYYNNSLSIAQNIELERIPTYIDNFQMPRYLHKNQTAQLQANIKDIDNNNVKYGVVNFLHYDNMKEKDGNERGIGNPVLVPFDGSVGIKYAPEQNVKSEYLKIIYNWKNEYKYYNSSSKYNYLTVLQNDKMYSFPAIIKDNEIKYLPVNEIKNNIESYNCYTNDDISICTLLTGYHGELFLPKNGNVVYELIKKNSDFSEEYVDIIKENINNIPAASIINIGKLNINNYESSPQNYILKVRYEYTEETIPGSIVTSNGKYIHASQLSYNGNINNYVYQINFTVNRQQIQGELEYKILDKKIYFKINNIDNNIMQKLNNQDINIVFNQQNIEVNTSITINDGVGVLDLSKSNIEYCSGTATINSNNIDGYYFNKMTVDFKYSLIKEAQWNSKIIFDTPSCQVYPGKIKLYINTNNLQQNINFKIECIKNNKVETYYKIIEKDKNNTTINIEEFNQELLTPGEYKIKITPDELYINTYPITPQPISTTQQEIDGNSIIHYVTINKADIDIELDDTFNNEEINSNYPYLDIILKTNGRFFDENILNQCLVLYIEQKTQNILSYNRYTNIESMIFSNRLINNNKCIYNVAIPEIYHQNNKKYKFGIHFYGNNKYQSYPNNQNERTINITKTESNVNINDLESCEYYNFTYKTSGV